LAGEAIADDRGVHAQGDLQSGRGNVPEMIQRQPCSLQDIADGSDIHLDEVVKYVTGNSKGGPPNGGPPRSAPVALTAQPITTAQHAGTTSAFATPQ